LIAVAWFGLGVYLRRARNRVVHGHEVPTEELIRDVREATTTAEMLRRKLREEREV
jgi:hypothetical protein